MLRTMRIGRLGADRDFALDSLVTSAGRVYVGVADPDMVLLGLTVTLSGLTPVALPPKYQPPISVKTP